MSDRVSEERFTAGGGREEGKSFYRRLIKRCNLNLEEDGGRREEGGGTVGRQRDEKRGDGRKEEEV